MADRVARAVDARPLGVPDREHAVVAALAVEPDLLRARAGGGGEVLVDGGPVDDVVRVEMGPRPLQLLVVGAQRRAAIAGDEARRVQPGGQIALALHQRQPHQRLDAGDEDPPFADRVLVVERDLEQLRHLPTPSCPGPQASTVRERRRSQDRAEQAAVGADRGAVGRG